MYYLSFFYEVVDQIKHEKEKLYVGKNTDWNNVDQNLKYREAGSVLDPSDIDDLNLGNIAGHGRLLRSKWYSRKYGSHTGSHKALPANTTYHESHDRDYLKEPHMIITGQVILRNTHGYLSAHQYLFINVYGWFVFGFVVLGAVWMFML